MNRLEPATNARGVSSVLHAERIRQVHLFAQDDGFDEDDENYRQQDDRPRGVYQRGATEILERQARVHGITSKPIRTVRYQLARTFVRNDGGFGVAERHHSPRGEDDAEGQRSPAEWFER